MQLQIDHTERPEGIHEVVVDRKTGAGFGFDGFEHHDLYHVLILSYTSRASRTSGSSGSSRAACSSGSACAAVASGSSASAVASCAACTACSAYAAHAAVASRAAGSADAPVTSRASGSACAAVASCASAYGQIDGVRCLRIVYRLVDTRVVGVGAAYQLLKIKALTAYAQQLVGDVKDHRARLYRGGLRRLQAHIVGIKPGIAHHIYGYKQIPLRAEHMVRIGYR